MPELTAHNSSGSAKLYKEEESKLLNSFLENNVLKYWRPGGPETVYKRSLELYPSPVCNTKCAYCYIKNFGDKTYYDKDAYKPEAVIKNLHLILNWLTEQDLYPPTIEIFSGDIFASKNLYPEYFKVILDWIKAREGYHPHIIVPTNATWARDPSEIDRIDKIVMDFKAIGVRMGLSMSVDGAVVDNLSRPFRNPKIKYTQELYDNLLPFTIKHGYSYHPMISSQAIHMWKENLDWFVDHITQYGVPFKTLPQVIYMLEVRNPDWSLANLRNLDSFIEHLVDVTFERICDADKDYFVDKILFNKGFNILGSPFSYIPRGLYCSYQTALVVRGDLKIIGCHRVGYDGYEAGEFVVEDGRIAGIRPINIPFYMASMSYNFKSGPYCDACPLRTSCSGYCLGSNMEITGDPFVVPPTVCRLEHAKTMSIFNALDKRGLLDQAMDRLLRSSIRCQGPANASHLLRRVRKDGRKIYGFNH